MKRVVLIVACFFVVMSPLLFTLFHPGFLVTDDGNWMIIRLSAFYEALRQGQFPVRFLPRLNNGYGYPVADFLYPLFLYLGSFIHIFHINFTLTIKILFALSIGASFVGSYLWLRKQFGALAAFVGATIYSIFPYHMWDITKRGSLGEVLAMGIVPFIFWQIDSSSILLTALGIALLILSHNTLALLFLPILILYMILERKIKLGIFSLLLGITLSAFFWLPALFDKQFTVFDTTSVASFTQYFLTSQLYSLIGIVSFVVIILAAIGVVRKQNHRVIFFLVVTLFSLSLTNRVSQNIWEVLQLGKYVQFPFRFLSIAALGIGFLGAYIIGSAKKSQSFFIAGVCIILVYLSSWSFLFTKNYQYYPDTYYSTNQDTTTVQNEYMPKTVRKQYLSSQHEEVSGKAITSTRNLVDKGSTLSFTLQTSHATQITIGKVFFPGWVVMVDDKSVKMLTNDYGFIMFTVPQGNHAVVARFGETTLRIIADCISVAGLLFLLAMVFLPMIRLKRK